MIGLRLLLSVGAVVATIVGAHAQSANPPVFRSRATAVSLDVSVKRGNLPVADLTAADFVVSDNGVAQSVEHAFTNVVPVDVTLIVDASSSTATIFNSIRKDAEQILGLLGPDDRARILVIETTPYELLPLQTAGGGLALTDERVPGHLSSIYDAILAALVRRSVPDRRRMVVAITDGVDTKSITSVDTLERIARRTDSVLHIISVRPVRTANAAPPVRTISSGFVRADPTSPELDIFERLPALTGGACHGSSHTSRPAANVNAVAVVGELIEEFRKSYVIQYMPRDVTSGGWHDVVVRVQGVDPRGVRTRAGYFDAAR